jgi:hypothetical protein
MPVDVSQQLIPDPALGQLVWQSASEVQFDTHCPPPLDEVEVDVEVLPDEVDVDVLVAVVVVVVEPPPKPPTPSVSLPDAQAAKSAGATRASATKVKVVCFTLVRGYAKCRMVYKRLSWRIRRSSGPSEIDDVIGSFSPYCSSRAWSCTFRPSARSI